jgi:hypothetical protein
VFNDTIGFANQGYYQINNVFETDSCYYAEGSADEIGNFIGKKFFLKFNKQGLLLKSQLYGDISTSFSEYDDGTTIQIGDGFLCCNNVKDTINGYGYLMKVDYNLVTVWSLKFDSTNMSTMFGLGDLKSFTFEDIKVTPDGGYLVAGYLMKLSASNSSSFLLKLDGLGVKQWSRLYDSLPRVSCIELTPDLGILMLDDYGFSQVAKTNALGDLQWTQSVNSSYSYGTPGAIVYAGDSGYVVARPYVYNGNFQMPKYGLNLTKVNYFDGSVIWDKHFDSTWYLESLVRVRCHLNVNGDIAIGGTKAYKITLTETYFSDAGFLLIVNASGDSLRCDHYTYLPIPKGERLMDLIPTDDGGFLGGGQYYGNWIGWRPWIFKTQGTVTQLEDKKPNDVNLGIYPNPAQDVVNITIGQEAKRLRSAQVYDIAGRLLKSIDLDPVQSTLQISIIDLPNGVYIVRLLTNEGLYMDKKLIVSR